MKLNKLLPTNGIIFSLATLSVLKDRFPCTTTLWNDISIDIRCLKSIGSFKQALSSFYNVPSYNATYDFAIDRFNAIFHVLSLVRLTIIFLK